MALIFCVYGGIQFHNEDVRISKEIVDRLVDATRAIRNTVRYLLGNFTWL